jgi:methyltransferase (TIGR00027 family)
MTGNTNEDDKKPSHDVWSPENAAKINTESCKLVAAIRAVNTDDPTVDFQEPLAAYLAGDRWVELIKCQHTRIGTLNAGTIDSVSFLSQLVDEATIKACKQDGIRQVVVLGAGMDTRPYRLDLPDVNWYEVDVPAMSVYKKHKMGSVPTDLKEHAVLKTRSHHYIPIDLAKSLPDLDGALKSAGFDRNAPVLYVMEGLVYYLTSEENLLLLDSLPTSSSSQAVVTCISRSFVAKWSSPAVQAKFPDAKRVLSSWKLNSDVYLDVVRRSRHWKLYNEIKINYEAENRGYKLSDPLGIGVTTASELFLTLCGK